MAARKLPALEQLDPRQAWEPWEPGSSAPWDLKWAGHLYRRAAFGGSPAELRQAVRQGPQKTLALLLNGQPRAGMLMPFLEKEGAKIARRFNPTARFFENRPEPVELRSWWIYCMLNSGHPLREKMTLFWHNHFATSIAKVTHALPMLRQNILLRRQALGKMKPLLLEISKDPAMLIWLDSNSNIKGKPNENYAREVMELFTLGVGHYTEKDIQEAARAFTGWHTDGERFDYRAAFHDEGMKTVLGQTGRWNGEDIIRILLEQPAAARFLVGKLYVYFVSEAQEPPAALLEPLAEQLRQSDYDIGAVVRTMLSSRLFFSEHAYRQRIKSPVELVLGGARALVQGPTPPQPLTQAIDQMGQQLFAPPNVKGWPGSKTWLNTATLLSRQDFATRLALGTLWPGSADAGVGSVPLDAPVGVGTEERAEEPPPPSRFDPVRLVREARATAPDAIVGVLLDALLPGGISATRRQQLTTFLTQGSSDGSAADRRIRETAQAILSMPEYQLA